MKKKKLLNFANIFEREKLRGNALFNANNTKDFDKVPKALKLRERVPAMATPHKSERTRACGGIEKTTSPEGGELKILFIILNSILIKQDFYFIKIGTFEMMFFLIGNIIFYHGNAIFCAKNNVINVFGEAHYFFNSLPSGLLFFLGFTPIRSATPHLNGG